VDGPTTRKRGQHVSAIINHHAWENAKFTKDVIGAITSGIEEYAFDDVRPLFRIFTGLLMIKDSIKAERIDWSLSALLAVMKQQDRYWKITDLCIEHLIRIAKKNQDVYTWLHAHPERWAWLIEWVNAFPQQPGHMDQNSIMLHKPGKGSHMNVWSRGYGGQSFTLPGKRKKLTLELIRDDKEIDKADASDSDEDLSERVFVLNQLVDCKDTASKWLISKVLEVKEGSVYIHYEGWSNKWDEWIDSDSPRIAKLHRHTQPPAASVPAVVGNPAPEGQAPAEGTTASNMAVVVHNAGDP
jgi:hypothetical protein